MRARWIVNLLLAIAIAILLLVAYYEPGIDEQAESPAITSLKKDQLHRVHLNRSARNDLVLVKTATGGWSIEHVPELPADDFQVNALLRLTEQKAVRSYPASELDLKKLQLAPPNATAIFNDTAVEFGNLEPLDGLRYVRVADQVHLIPDDYLQLIEASYTQFVRRRLLDDSARINRLVLPAFAVTREDHGWSVEPRQDVSGVDLQQFVDRWRAAVALHVQAADKTSEGESVEVLQAGERQSVRFVILAREPELVLARPELGIQYRMGDLGEDLLNVATPASADQE